MGCPAFQCGVGHDAGRRSLAVHGEGVFLGVATGKQCVQLGEPRDDGDAPHADAHDLAGVAAGAGLVDDGHYFVPAAVENETVGRLGMIGPELTPCQHHGGLHAVQIPFQLFKCPVADDPSVPWSAVKQRLIEERRRVAGLFLKETEENLAGLSEGKLLASKQLETAKESDQLQFLDTGLRRQLEKAYDRVTTVNDALVKYQRFRSAGAGQDDYEKKTAEFQQYIAWYREGLNTALLNLRGRLIEELREPPEPETMAREP